MISLLAMSLGLRFCVSRKGGTGGGGWAHPKERVQVFSILHSFACVSTLQRTHKTTIASVAITLIQMPVTIDLTPVFLACSTRASTASDKCWGEKAWTQG